MVTAERIPKISIVMPTYNRAHYLMEAIESVQKQTYQNWELLIVDDGSEDHTNEVVAAISDSRIRYFKENRNGMEKARNIGLENARGELIGFMDSDDLWMATKLEKQVRAFEDHPEACFCLAGGCEFREPGVPLVYFYKQKEGIKYGDLFLPFFRSEVAATMPTLIFKKECLQVTGNFSEKKPVSHITFILSLARSFEGIVLYEPLFCRRLHDSNYSSVNAVKRHLEGLEMIRLYKNDLPPALYTDALFRSHLNFGGKYLEHKKEGKALHQFLQAWKYKPLNIIPLKKMGRAVLQLLKF